MQHQHANAFSVGKVLPVYIAREQNQESPGLSGNVHRLLKTPALFLHFHVYAQEVQIFPVSDPGHLNSPIVTVPGHVEVEYRFHAKTLEKMILYFHEAY